MFLKTGKKVYWKKNWTDPNEPWHVGNLVSLSDDRLITFRGVIAYCYVTANEWVLVRHSRTVDETKDVLLEFVEWSKLYNYYGDKTPPEFEKEYASVPYKSDERLKEIGRFLTEKEYEANY